MNKRNKTFLLAFYMFLSSIFGGCKCEKDDNICEVVDVNESVLSDNEEKNTTLPTETFNNDDIIYIDENNNFDESIEQNNKITLTIDEVALLTIGGRYGNGEERKINITNLGYDYEVISKRVNEIMNGEKYSIPDRNTYIYNFGYVNEKVDVYDEHGNREGSLSAYQKFLITENKIDDMVFVHFNDQTFYLKEKDIHRLADSHIEIDISLQKVYLYIDGELILDADVITGYPGKGTTPGTNLGITSVYSISYNVTFTPEKKSEIFILFNWDGEGFHDAPWRESWEFSDKERYLTHGSDGCSNMMFNDVKVIEENCYLGMPVLSHK